MEGQDSDITWATGSSFHDRCIREAAIHTCIKARDGKHLKEITDLVGFDPSEIFTKDRETCSALCMAVENDWPEGVQYLICAGADVNSRTEIIECWFGWTCHMISPLIAAIQTRHLSCARVLIQFGADVNYVDPCGQISCLHLAVYTNNPAAVHLLLTSSLTSSIDVNARGSDINCSPLSLAVGNMGYNNGHYPTDCSIFVENTKVRQNKCLTILKMLLDAGANVNDFPFGQIPPAFLCATATDTRIMDLFLRYGLDVDISIRVSTLKKEHAWLSYIGSSSASEYLSLLTYYLSAEYFNVAEVLVKFGATVSSNDYLLIHNAHEQHCLLNNKILCIQSLHAHVTKAPTLSWFCRRTIRIQGRVRLEKDIQCLPLPTVLKLYLMGDLTAESVSKKQ